MKRDVVPDRVLEGQPVAPSSEPSIPADYKFKTSEEAELLPMPLQILRLKDINAGLCDTHNTLVIMNASAEDRIAEALQALEDLGPPVREAFELWSAWQYRVTLYDKALAALAAPSGVAKL
jgi:hypothetical protein